jgi:hypothetical protein
MTLVSQSEAQYLVLSHLTKLDILILTYEALNCVPLAYRLVVSSPDPLVERKEATIGLDPARDREFV